MQSVFNGRDDAEVAAAAAQRPEQIGVFSRVRHSELTVSGHDIGRDHVVDGETVLAHQPAQAAAECESRDAGVRYHTTGRGKPERLRLAVQFTPDDAALDVRRSLGRVDADAFHRRHVDHQAAVVGAIPGRAVATVAHGEPKSVRSREVHGSLDIGDAGAPCDDRGAAIDVAVPHPPGVLVARMILQHQISANRAAKLRDLRVAKRNRAAVDSRCNRGHVVRLSINL